MALKAAEQQQQDIILQQQQQDVVLQYQHQQQQEGGVQPQQQVKFVHLVDGTHFGICDYSNFKFKFKLKSLFELKSNVRKSIPVP